MFRKSYENPGNPMEIPIIPWKSRKSHENPGNPMEIPAIPGNPGNPKSAVSPLVFS
jgi:hypothetical protein